MKIFLILLSTLTLYANIGNIMSLKGMVEVQRADKLIGAVSGMSLKNGDELITHKKSRAQVMLKDDTVVTVGSNSSFVFEDIKFDGSKNSKMEMRAKRGFFRSVTGQIGKIAPERFKLRTVSATIGIRGTDFSGNILKSKEIFKCYSGSISVQYGSKSKVVDAGMMLKLFGGKGSLRVNTKAKGMAVKQGIRGRKQAISNSVGFEVINTSLEPFTIDIKTLDREIKY